MLKSSRMRELAASSICKMLFVFIFILLGSVGSLSAQDVSVEAFWPAQGERSPNKQVGFSYNGPGKLMITTYYDPVRIYGNDFGGIGGSFPDCPGCRIGEYMRIGGGNVIRGASR